MLALLAIGLPNRAIADRLFVTERTVEVHVKQIFRKLALTAGPSSHWRVLAVLAYLAPAEQSPPRTGGPASLSRAQPHRSEIAAYIPHNPHACAVTRHAEQLICAPPPPSSVSKRGVYVRRSDFLSER